MDQVSAKEFQMLLTDPDARKLAFQRMQRQFEEMGQQMRQ